MKITKIKIEPGKFLQLEENERVFFIMISIFANEIAVLHKLIAYSSGKEHDNPVLVRAQNTQAMLMIKLLGGLLFEGWKILHNDYFSSKLSKEYDPLLTLIGKESIQKIKAYFSRDRSLRIEWVQASKHLEYQRVASSLL